MLQSAKGTSSVVPAPGTPTQSPPRGVARSFFAWLRHAIPTLLIFAALGALAYWGHHTEWRFTATPTDHKKIDTQASSHWLEITPEVEKLSWCPRHGVHACPLCNPDVAEIPTPPVITRADQQQADRALSFRERPDNARGFALSRRSVRFESEDAVTRVGIDVAPVYRTAITEFAAAPAEVMYDATRLARLSVRADGTVWRVLKRLGDRVQADEVLAYVDAAAVGKAKADFIEGHVQVALRGRTLRALNSAEGAVAAIQRREAETAYREAQIRLAAAQQALVNLGLPVDAADFREVKAVEINRRLQFLGLPEVFASSLDGATTTANLLPVRTPFTGEVIKADVVTGEVVDTSRVLFAVADTRKLWLKLNIAPQDAAVVHPGLKVVFRPDGEQTDVTGKVIWVSTAADEKTRTVRVRAELPNLKGQLRSGTLGTGQVVLREEPRAIVVPTTAIQSVGGCQVVFVRDRQYLKSDGPKRFHVRTIRPGARSGEYTEVIAGLWPDEVVVTKGGAFLRSEVQRNVLGPVQSGHRR